MIEDWVYGGFGLYIHWPFCQAKCPYCDFNSFVSKEIDQTKWRDAYIVELRRTAALTPNRVLNSVFFGGGTPSLMDPQIVDDILQEVQKNWTIANDIEITLEANPTSVEAGRFADFRGAGINRVSMGIQSLNDQDLRKLGRTHSVSEGIAAFETARNEFERVSFDLIYARQGQTLQDWNAELGQALEMAVDHLSLYQLTIEDGTAFGDRFAAGKLRDLPTDDNATDMYFATQELTSKHGMKSYEVSNHAKVGSESRHNLIYWNGGDYIGIGPGAHGRLTNNGIRYATETELSPVAWLSKVAKNGSGQTIQDAMTRQDELTERFTMGLRLATGVDLGRLGLENHKKSFENSWLAEDQIIEVAQESLIVTAKGRPVLNAVIVELLRLLD